MNLKLDWSLIATKEEIENLYISEQWPVTAIADHLGVGSSTLRNKMKELSIPIRKPGFRRKGIFKRKITSPKQLPPKPVSINWEKITSKRELNHLYLTKLNPVKLIAKILEVPPTSLRKYMKKIGIQLRKPGFKKVNQNSLHKRLLNSTNFSKRRWKDLASEFNCSISTVNRAKSAFLKQQRELNKIKENQIPD